MRLPISTVSIKLFDHQESALERLHSGAVLYGGVGSGKTYTALYFYKENYLHLDLIVITTAKKRDTGDWEEEASNIGVENLIVDSWNNIEKYKKHSDSFFVFDEQRAVGYGKWGRSMIFIARRNKWIMLTATPGDVWMDYMPIFVANNWYKHKTDFVDQHVEYDPWVKYPKVKKYHNEAKLKHLRDTILVPMEVERHTTRNRKFVESEFDNDIYNKVMNDRWNVFEDKPIENASELTQVLRKIVASDPSRIWKAKWLMDVHSKVIVFYNYNYELDILKNICIELNKTYAQWNGHAHEELPETDSWIYLVQYTAGSEGWNCIDTNIVIFYSLNYSFRTTEQAEGRIDRINTPFDDLEYFYLTSKSKIDRSVKQAVTKKKRFNESAWVRGSGITFQ